ncbi:MAG: formate dehydrogenase accessory protein FdhE [Candidatus Rokubacteria bacterium]|nr:formate dehydrogenase accessory protein FdhE [Candidatus Rokubacteria bacterium]
MTTLDLRDAWRDLLRRRAALGDALSPYGEIVDRWAGSTASAPPIDATPDDGRARWARGVPLLADQRVPLAAGAVEELLAPALDLAAAIRPDAAAGLAAFATAWDAGEVAPDALLPARGRIGRLAERYGLDDDVLGFLAVASLRPLLESSLEPWRARLGPDDWSLAVCPFCGAPPGWGDIVEGGRLELACHLCGGTWRFSRARCPFCGDDDAKSQRRLTAEAGEEGYAIIACTACRAYLKELDRRERWNGGPPLLEDWASPHLDVAVRRQGYWRPLAPVIIPG